MEYTEVTGVHRLAARHGVSEPSRAAETWRQLQAEGEMLGGKMTAGGWSLRPPELNEADVCVNLMTSSMKKSVFDTATK